MKRPWQKLSSKIVYQNPWITVREDKVIRPDGKKGIYGYIYATDCVGIVAINGNDEIYLIKQWRYVGKMNTIELPWGGCKQGEKPLHAAKRELLEETGLVAIKWYSLGYFVLYPALSTEKSYLYLAKDLKLLKSQPEGTEKLFVIKLPFKKAYQWAIKRKINDSFTTAAILRVKEYLKL